MKEVVIKIDEGTYNNFVRNEYSRADVIAIHTALINGIPPATPQEPKTGHWSHDGSHWKNRFICSECGYKLFDEPTNYCPNCGARMVKPQESEDKE